MKTASFLALALCLCACNDYAAAQKADSIEGWEEYLKENPTSPRVVEASIRLEELYLEKAEQEGSVEAYDAYLARFPEGTKKEEAHKARQEALFGTCQGLGTAECWQKYLDEYPKADRVKKAQARAGIKMADYLPYLEVSAPRWRPVNLAEDPTGPLDGWEIAVDVTNKGDKSIEFLSFTAAFKPSPTSRTVYKEWPLVSKDWILPAPDIAYVPIAPGETRTWSFWTADLPQGWTGTATVVPSGIKLVGEAEGETGGK